MIERFKNSSFAFKQIEIIPTKVIAENQKLYDNLLLSLMIKS